MVSVPPVSVGQTRLLFVVVEVMLCAVAVISIALVFSGADVVVADRVGHGLRRHLDAGDAEKLTLMRHPPPALTMSRLACSPPVGLPLVVAAVKRVVAAFVFTLALISSLFRLSLGPS